VTTTARWVADQMTRERGHHSSNVTLSSELRFTEIKLNICDEIQEEV